jgi:SAM-dependent methyltransferase
MSRFDNINIFTNIYEGQLWGGNSSVDGTYRGTSGKGSNSRQTHHVYTPLVRRFILDHGIFSVLDLGCGDWQSSGTIYDGLDVKYTGYDAYELVCLSNQKRFPGYRFVHADFIREKESLPSADLCIMKDVLQHLCNQDIAELLDYLVTSKKYRYILTTNCCPTDLQDPLAARHDIDNGDWRPLSRKLPPLAKYGWKALCWFPSDGGTEIKEMLYLETGKELE